MRRMFRNPPSPAMVLAAVALILALAGTAIAGPDRLTREVTKSKVKKISKKQANKQITKRAPGLSVANAETANRAEIANSFGGMTAQRVDPFTLGNGQTRVIGQFGAFTLTASCTINQANTDIAAVTITTNQNNSAFRGEDEDPDFDVGDSPLYVEANITPTATPEFSEDSGVAIAPDGSEIFGHQLYAGVNVFGQPGQCRFGGVVFVG
jgi:hypothetical protein